MKEKEAARLGLVSWPKVGRKLYTTMHVGQIIRQLVHDTGMIVTYKTIGT